MGRAFCTHKLRKSVELDGLWKFYTMKDPEHVRQVVVPSCWETYPGLENYRGKAVYEKEFYGEGNLHLIFKGISHTAIVYLDGVKIAEHYNAFTPFEKVVADVQSGLHKLKIEVDNSFNEESALHVVNDYFTYGGINRPVIIEEVAELFIERLHFTPYRKGGKWHGKVQVRVHNLAGSCPIKIRINLDDKNYGTIEGIAETGITTLDKELVFEDVISYELDAPKLYYINTTIDKDGKEIDDYIDRIGFREIKIEGNKILFNDKPIRIKGFNRHEDHGLYGCAIPYESMDYDLRLIEDMNANAVRTCHYPNDERFLDLCDEKGILVWEEGHARGLNEEQMQHKNFRKQSLDCIDEMIDNHYNHPSIFTWGILNECASNTEYGKVIYKEQFDRIKELDQSRPTTFASCHYKSDICLDLPDIVSMNIYPLWYHDSPAEEFIKDVYEWVQETEGKGKPYIVSEIGAGAIPGFHAPGNPKWSEERQSMILKEQLQAVLSHKNTSGVFIWQFCDGRVPDECFYARPRSMNNKGVVDEYRRKKIAYQTVKDIFISKN